jgi:hypothetical protein
MSLKTRVVKLESILLAKKEPIHVAIFLVAPGVEPIGYVSGDVTIIREPGESVEALQKRCHDAVTWPDGNYWHIFGQLEEGACPLQIECKT